MKKVLIAIAVLFSVTVNSSLAADNDDLCPRELLIWNSEVNMKNVYAAYTKIKNCVTAEKRPTLLLTTEGGNANAALAFVDLMRTNNLSDKFDIVASGWVYSSGVLLLAATDNRTALPSASFFVHERTRPSSNEDPRAIERMLDLGLEHQARVLQAAGIDITSMHYTDRVLGVKERKIFSAQEALTFNLITAIN